MGEELLDAYSNGEEVKYKHTTIEDERLLITASRLIISKNSGDNIISFNLESIESIKQEKEQESQDDGLGNLLVGVSAVTAGGIITSIGAGPSEIQLGLVAIGFVFGFIGFIQLLNKPTEQYIIRFIASDSRASLQVSRENVQEVVKAVESQWE